MIRVCFVCLGNICRSPTAEAVMRHLVREAGLEHQIEVSSAGTAGYHVGEMADSRARAAAKNRGIVMDGRARQFRPSDWQRFAYVLAMDRANLDDLREMAAAPESLSKLKLLRSFDESAPRGAAVPDPYYGGDDGFEEVLDLCEVACRGLLAQIRREQRL